MGLLDYLNQPNQKLTGLLQKLDAQSFRPGDSMLLSAINNPLQGIQKGAEFIRDNVNTASSPYAPSYQQGEAATNLAGLAQLGSFPMAPKSAGGTLGTFIGPKAATWDKNAADEAAKMLDSGVDPAQVWKEKLIGRMPDGALFSEIDDSGSYINNDKLFHKNLGLNYYGLPDKVNFGIESEPGVSGIRTKNRIDVTENAINPLSTAIHELQHEIQAIEGTPIGGNFSNFPDADSLKKGKIIAALQRKGFDEKQIKSFLLKPEMPRFYQYPDTSGKVAHDINSSTELKKYYQSLSKEPSKNYLRLTGEAQARAAQDRLNMSMEERRNNYPLAGGKLSDIPIEQLINRYGSMLLPATALGYGMMPEQENAGLLKQLKSVNQY